MPGPSRVRARGFGLRYTTRRAWALTGVDLVVEPGERLLLTGASGSGQTSRLYAVGGLLGSDEVELAGELTVDGGSPRTARDRLGLLAQDPDSQLVMTLAGDDVAFGLENAGVPADRIWPRVDAALERVGFGYGRGRATHALSGGEKQRLVLAGALVRAPGLLLLDEPTSQLDPSGAALVRAAVAASTADRTATLIVVDHDAAPWLPLVDRVVEVRIEGGLVEHPSTWRPAERTAGLRLARRTPAVLGAGVPPPSAGSAQPSAAGALPSLAGPRSSPVPLPAGPVPLSAGRTQPPGTIPPPSGAGRLSDEGDQQPSAAGPPPPAGPVPLSAEAAGFSYPRALGPALSPTSVDLLAGRAIAVTGPNGSGKSTLGLLLAGLRAPSTGQIRASSTLAAGVRKGRLEPCRWTAGELVTRIGTVFQNPEHQFLTRRLRDELALGPLRSGALADRARDVAFGLLDRLGLTAYADANPFTLSGGQQRRLSVATALATSPAVLVLDEPTFGQDAGTWQEVVRLLAELRTAGRALCLITHDRDLVSALADAEVVLAADRAGVRS